MLLTVETGVIKAGGGFVGVSEEVGEGLVVGTKVEVTVVEAGKTVCSGVGKSQDARLKNSTLARPHQPTSLIQNTLQLACVTLLIHC